MNDLITPLVENPAVYSFFYFSRIFFLLFATLTLINCVRQTRRVWSDFRWWAGAQNGMPVEQKRVVAEGRFAVGMWHSMASSLLTLTAAIAMVTLLLGPIPRPEVAATQVVSTGMLLTFIFCFYKSSAANGDIDRKLRSLEAQMANDELSKRKDG